MQLESWEHRRLGRYQITGVLGRGGMASVYRAHDTVLNRDVALKVLHPHYGTDESLLERFKREAVLAARLEHPHIVPIYDVGEANGTAYIAMMLLEGQTLADLLRASNTLPLSQVISITEQIAAALDYAHSRGVVHRDIKAGNIILEGEQNVRNTQGDGDSARAMLTDFGIAKSLDAPGVTNTGILIGTPDYMAPEQISNQPVDGRTDVYALGVMVFRCLTGRRPFEGGTDEVLLGHLYGTVPNPSTINPTLPAAIDPIIQKAMARQPDQRYATAGEFARALRLAATSRSIMPPPVRRSSEVNVANARTVVNNSVRPRANMDAATVKGAITPVPFPSTSEIPVPEEAQYRYITPRRRTVPWWMVILVFLLFLSGGGLLLAKTIQSTNNNGGGVIGAPTTLPTSTVRPTELVPTATNVEAITPLPQPTATVIEPTTEPTATLVPPTATVPPVKNTPVVPTSPATPTTPVAPTSVPAPASCQIKTMDVFAALLAQDATLQSKMCCPTQPSSNRDIMEQPFERGSMLRIAGPKNQLGVIYVIARDESTGIVHWQEFPDTWRKGEPDNSGNQQAPPGMYIPTDGFGKVWSNNKDVFNTLGYALAPAQSDIGPFQTFVGGRILFSPLSYLDELQAGLGKDQKTLGLERDKPIYVFFKDRTLAQYTDPTK